MTTMSLLNFFKILFKSIWVISLTLFLVLPVTVLIWVVLLGESFNEAVNFIYDKRYLLLFILSVGVIFDTSERIIKSLKGK